MPKFRVGDRYERLTILQVLPKANAKEEQRYLCQCDCGNRKAIRGANMRPGQTTGCGCGRRLRWGKPKTPSGVPDAVIAADDGKYPTAAERRAARLKLLRETARRLKALEQRAAP
jgi:hypothetical protein